MPLASSAPDPTPVLVFLSLRTLVDYGALDRAAFNAAFRLAGLDWSWSAEDHACLPGGESDVARLRAAARARDQIIAVADIAALKGAILRATIGTRDLRLRPGVDRALSAARASGARLLLVSGQSPDTAAQLLAAAAGAPRPREVDLLFRREGGRIEASALVLRDRVARLGGSPEDVRAIGTCTEDMGLAAQAGLVACEFAPRRLDA
jgi:phosphoglycolate phosphatase-like HAD superfamily hydrolase